MNNPTPERDEKIIEYKDFLVVKDRRTALDLIRAESLKGKWVIIAPRGLEFVSLRDLLRLPQVSQAILKGKIEVLRKLKMGLEDPGTSTDNKALFWRNIIRRELNDNIEELIQQLEKESK